jgi:hypothetical protein
MRRFLRPGAAIAAALLLATPARAEDPAARLARAEAVVQAAAARAANHPVDPVGFGADPQGIRDSAAAFHAAAASGRDVMLPCGHFVLSHAIPLAAGTRWQGQGDCTVLRPLPGNRSGLFVIEHQHDVLLGAMLLDGNRDVIGNDTPLVTSVDSARVVFRDLTVQHTRGVGLTFSHAVASGVAASRFRDIGTFNGGRPIGPGGPFDPTFRGSAWMALDFNDRGGDAPDPRDRDDFVLDSRFELLGGSAVAAGQQIGFLFARNQVDNRASGWRRGQQAALGTAFAGIYLHRTQGALVIGNTISGVSGDGIDSWENTDFAIIGNVVTESGLGGIDIAGPAERFAVLGNAALDNYRAAGLRAGNTYENAGIVFGAQPLMAHAVVQDGVVAGNVALGGAAGIQAFPNVVLRRVWIDAWNVLGPEEGPVRSLAAAR